MTRPNIFRFATKELTQDAFLCWCLSWANQDENLPMKRFSIELIMKMLNLHRIDVPHLDSMEEFEVVRQHENIDILVRFKIGNQHYRIIIEDKTNTAMHSNQLLRYFNVVKDENCAGPTEIVGIYYKTGYVFDNEHKYITTFNKNHGRFQILSRQSMIEIMDKHIESVTSDLFHDYYDYICDLQREENEILQNLMVASLELNTKSLRTQIGQWVFMKELFTEVEEEVSIYRGNSSGRPWTQCLFRKSNTSVDFPEALFYRLDKRKEGLYLSLRQYYNYENSNTIAFLKKPVQAIREEKVKRLRELIDLFNETIVELRGSDYLLEPGKRVTDYKGKKESEIGVFFFNETNTPEKVKRFIPFFHKLFLLKLEENW